MLNFQQNQKLPDYDAVEAGDHGDVWHGPFCAVSAVAAEEDAEDDDRDHVAVGDHFL